MDYSLDIKIKISFVLYFSMKNLRTEINSEPGGYRSFMILYYQFISFLCTTIMIT